MEEARELVFMPGPGMGHLVAAVEMGKLLINRDQRLSITYLIIDLPYDIGINAYTHSISASNLRFIHLPPPPKLTNPDQNRPPSLVYFDMMCSQQPKVRDTMQEIMKTSVSKVACVILDMFCAGMIDVGHELGLPSYVFFTSSAAFLGLQFHSVRLSDEDNIDIAEYKDSDAELSVDTFTNPVPAKVLPTPLVDRLTGGSKIVVDSVRKILQAKGIMINTFLELEPFSMKSLSTGKNPPVYPIGPVVNLANQKKDSTYHDIMNFLDNQPPSSVVFLCFGSQGWFPEDQVKEIAYALERSGCRFLWSLKRPPADGSLDAPGEYGSPEEVLPGGFLERTLGIGKIIGNAPQVAILSHPAIGGFVSHCGWNSILESLWFGVPIAAWPSYAEQQVNAFEIVVELGLGVDIRMDYRIENCKNVIVGADEIESAISRLMMIDSEERKKVKELQNQSKKSLIKGGSSYNNLGNLIKNILGEYDV
ncbi:hypothetical protein Leryth_025715 [Lithospermum erythrorhizon]|nr:hypothetical protein Leryth_025715 [Lithospermum erythrorhizon]